MSKRIITLGTWGGKPIEWIVLKADRFGVLVICKERIGTFRFNDNSSNNSWGSSSLRKYLNREFFNKAFSDEEKKKIVNLSLDSTKDDVFILTKNEITELLLKDGGDPYENNHYNNCSYCCWTRSKNGSNVDNGYARGCWCSHPSSSTYSVRPAIYIRDCKTSGMINEIIQNLSCIIARQIPCLAKSTSIFVPSEKER